MVQRDPIFEARTNVKMHSKTLKRESLRAETTFKSEKAKAEKAMHNREFQIARIHVGSASTRDTSRTLAMASRGLDAASKSVNLENLLAHANNFLARSEDFKIASSAIESVAQGVAQQEHGAEGEADVDKLMEQLADEAGVDLRLALDADAAPKDDIKDPKHVDVEVEDVLGARLRALRAVT
jgi:charged multivesicular body protein 1